MSPKHSHGPHRTHHAHAHPSHRHGHHHAPHPPHPRRRPSGGLLARIGRALFCTRRGNVSRPKLISFGIVFVGIAYILLVRGFFPFDVASPWVAAALERQLGPGHRVEIGRTHLEHDPAGAPVLRVEGIRVYGPGGKVIANAPRAEVGLDGTSLLIGSFRARRIDLVGAETTVYVGTDGRVAIAAGSDAAPLTEADTKSVAADAALASTPARAAAKGKAKAGAVAPVVRPEPFHYPELARWLASFEKGGLDGVALAQIGLKQGSLTVEDAETGRTWSFRDINIQLSRPAEGGLVFSLSSSGADAGWSLTATVAPMQGDVRAIDVVAHNLAPGDIMLAAGVADLDFLAENALSGILRAQIAADGRLVSANFRAAAGPGHVGRRSSALARFHIDDIQVQARFDAERRATVIEPLIIQSGANRLGLSVVVEAPAAGRREWPVLVPQGILFLSTGREEDAPLVLDRVTMRGVFDAAAQRLVVQQGNLAGATAGGAFSGSLTLGPKPMLALGIASSHLPVPAAKRLWPAIVARGTRAWALEQVEQGVLDRILIALNVPVEAIGKPGVELPDGAVRLEFSGSGGAFWPGAGLPLVRDAQVSGLVTGRTVRVQIPKAFVDTPQGRRIALSEGVLEVPDHLPANPAGNVRFHLAGPADALAEMAATGLLRGVTGFAAEPATVRGTVSAAAQLDLVFRQDMRGEEVRYVADGEIRDFAADGLVRGQRVEGMNAKVTLSADELRAKGAGRIAGAPASFEFRRAREKAESEFRVTATLDDAARARVGMNLAPWLVGPVQVEAHGRSNERENRYDVNADLTTARVSDLVPGWQKPIGRAAKASFRVVEQGGSLRLEDLSVVGGGTTLKGSLALDGEGGFVAADLPVFHLSDGDRASLRAERAPDGTLRVSVRGDVLDARGTIRGLTAAGEAAAPGQTASPPRDLELELRLGAATGHNGEVARQLDLRVVRRNGEIRGFSLLGRIGRDASMVGELRRRENGDSALYITSGDAGALLRFADFYRRVYGGEAWIVIEPPRTDGRPQEGIINVRDFIIRGEPTLDRMQAAAPPEPAEPRDGARRTGQQAGVPFLRMQVEFNRSPGRFNIRDAVIYGPTIGANVDGILDFANDRVHLRGTYIPAYGLNNLFAQLPIVGLFLGGPREGLIAITFEIVGPASGPMLRVNPMSAAAPGFLRKLFEFRGAADAPGASGPFDPN